MQGQDGTWASGQWHRNAQVCLLFAGYGQELDLLLLLCTLSCYLATVSGIGFHLTTDGEARLSCRSMSPPGLRRRSRSPPGLRRRPRSPLPVRQLERFPTPPMVRREAPSYLAPRYVDTHERSPPRRILVEIDPRDLPPGGNLPNGLLCHSYGSPHLSCVPLCGTAVSATTVRL